MSILECKAGAILYSRAKEAVLAGITYQGSEFKMSDQSMLEVRKNWALFTETQSDNSMYSNMKAKKAFVLIEWLGSVGLN